LQNSLEDSYLSGPTITCKLSSFNFSNNNSGTPPTTLKTYTACCPKHISLYILDHHTIESFKVVGGTALHSGKNLAVSPSHDFKLCEAPPLRVSAVLSFYSVSVRISRITPDGHYPLPFQCLSTASNAKLSRPLAFTRDAQFCICLRQTKLANVRTFLPPPLLCTKTFFNSFFKPSVRIFKLFQFFFSTQCVCF